ncbi:MAG: nitrilase family protein [Pirellulaceae bacterium]
MEKFKVAAVQFQHHASDKPYNLSVIRKFVQDAARQKVQAICFPECCVTGYWHLRKLDRDALLQLAEPIPDGTTTQTLLNWSAEYQITIGAGLIEVDSQGDLYNSYVVAMPNGHVALHRKLHCFISQYMESGNQIQIFTLPNGWQAATLICYDNNLIENVRIAALAGADIIFAPHQTGGCNSGSPFAMGVVDRQLWENRIADPDAIEDAFRGDKGRAWLMRWLPARAHDNGLFYIFSNGVGPDDNEVRTGNAMILDPYGRIVSETWQAADVMVTAELDRTLRLRSTGYRWLNARRPELYHPLVQPTGRERNTRAVRFDHQPPCDS